MNDSDKKPVTAVMLPTKEDADTTLPVKLEVDDSPRFVASSEVTDAPKEITELAKNTIQTKRLRLAHPWELEGN